MFKISKCCLAVVLGLATFGGSRLAIGGGTCANEGNPCQFDIDCDDGLFCTGDEFCDGAPNGNCSCIEFAPTCEDFDGCTIDVCDGSLDTCVNEPVCNVPPFLVCISSDPDPNNTTCVQCDSNDDCNDDIDCTDDECFNNSCGFTTNNGLCDDNDPCNGDEFCDPQAGDADPTTGCTPSSGFPCNPGEICDPVDGCRGCFNDAECDDGIFCNGPENCFIEDFAGVAGPIGPQGLCEPGTPPSCNDSTDCTIDSCNPITDVCDNVPDHSACDDGIFCNGLETCNPSTATAGGSSGCQGGLPPSCNDNVDCTTDTCSPDIDDCLHVPSNLFCDDLNRCDGTETCDSINDCQEGTPLVCDDNTVCNGVSICNPSTGCQPVAPPLDCDDLNACNGVETCDPIAGCRPGTPLNCNDGLACNGVETCSPTQGCLPSTVPINCNDGIPCTSDSCVEDSSSQTGFRCVFAPDDSLCDDDVFCNGEEICLTSFAVAGGGGGCSRGPAPNCNDGIACTVDSCDEAEEECVHTPAPALCQDASACNGLEVCVGGNCPAPVLCCGKGCQPAADLGQCENVGGIPVCFAPPCATSTCCISGQGCQTGVSPSNCLESNGVPICDGCQSVLCCNLNTVAAGGPQICVGGQTPASCSAAGGTPVCGDCGNVRCCPAAAAGDQNGGCLSLPLDFCIRIGGAPDCSGCRPGEPFTCDDQVDCTVDSCVEPPPSTTPIPPTCSSVADDALCDDGVFCNGEETCSPPSVAGGGSISGCLDGDPVECAKGFVCHPCVDDCAECLEDVDCHDGDPCTLDTCVDVPNNSFTCINTPIQNCIPPVNVAGISQKGSLLYFPKIEIKWDEDGNIIQDTFLTLFNDDEDEPVEIQAYFINGDRPLEEICTGDPCFDIIQAEEPGWNKENCRFSVTKTQPWYWSAALGFNQPSNPNTCQPFTALDDDGPGRPDPETQMETRVLRGFVVLWAVKFRPCVIDNPDGAYQEIRWNDLTGSALIVNYSEGSAWEYNSVAFRATNVAHGEFTGTPGILYMDSSEYDSPAGRLLLDFYATGSQAFSLRTRAGALVKPVSVDSDLTLMPVSVDLRQDNDGPVITKAEFSVWNESEVKLSGQRRCIQCWDETLFSKYARLGVPNYFLRQALGTDKGQARIEGLASRECDFLEPFFKRSENSPLLGVVMKLLSFGNPVTDYDAGGMNIPGISSSTAKLQYDLQEGNPEFLSTRNLRLKEEPKRAVTPKEATPTDRAVRDEARSPKSSSTSDRSAPSGTR